jgi:hypothetical protein
VGGQHHAPGQNCSFTYFGIDIRENKTFKANGIKHSLKLIVFNFFIILNFNGFTINSLPVFRKQNISRLVLFNKAQFGIAIAFDLLF